MLHLLISDAPLLALLIWAAAIDLRDRRIPNWLNGLMLLSGIARSFLPGPGVTPAQSMLGVLAGAAIPFVLFVLGAMGGGDVKLMAGIGAWLGPAPVLAVLVVEKVIGLVWILCQATAQGRMQALLKNSTLVTVNLLYVKDVGLEQAARTGRECRSVDRPLPFAVPTLIAAALVLLRMGMKS